MEDIDKNGDGFIDLKEYIGEYLSTPVQLYLCTCVLHLVITRY